VAPFSFSKDPKKGKPKGNKQGAGKPSPRKPRPQVSSDKRKSTGIEPGRKKPAMEDRAERRFRDFAVPVLPADITGDELEKRKRAELRPLAEENALAVAKHLVALLRFLDSDPALAYRHAQEATFRAGRIALVREYSGMAALRAGKFEVAQKDLRAAQRISGSVEILPFIAQCEVALGHARKALAIAGEVDAKTLSVAGQVELRIAAASARLALGQVEAAIVTLRCGELNTVDATWSKRLHRAYYQALLAAERFDEAQQFLLNFPQHLQDQS
jgi:hypothetical protein